MPRHSASRPASRAWSPLRRIASLAALVGAAACASKATVAPAPVVVPKAPPPPDGRTVIQTMNDRYIGKFYMTLTYKQNVSIIGANRRETRQVWNHYLTLPGRQRIDYVPLASKSGVLYADGRLYSFTNGKVANTQPGWHPLLVLTGDVYTQMPDTTVMQLDSLGFDLSIARKDTWEGREMWVVGAAAGDSTSSQFWVDTDSLLVRRIIQRETRSGRVTMNETRYLNYKPVAGYPVPHSMRAYRDGRLYFRGESVNVREGERLPVELFEPQSWATSQLKR
ncbi:MAG TPA: hypothetical protein VFV33_00970 [Gemmatimonadaceae bacterium]|nr:hypothetical protein [Gemmatimonadaceae bacterium]